MVSKNLLIGIKIVIPYILLFGGYVKVRQYLYIRVTICVILNHIDTTLIIPITKRGLIMLVEN